MHLVWFLVILCCLVIPLAWLFLPTAQTSVQIPVSTTDFTRLITAPLVSRQHYLELAKKSTHYAVISGLDSAGSPVGWQLWVVSVWAIGVVVLLIRGIAARSELGRIALIAEKCSYGQSYLNDLIHRYKIRKLITVVISTHCAMPFTFGIAQSRIVCTLFWFVPYIWIAYGQMVRESEKI